jgi:serine/threonine protein kinase
MHMDINPNNVMFSRSMQKIVFIDFGLSEIIKEDCGFETLTFYRGTPNYVCK